MLEVMYNDEVEDLYIYINKNGSLFIKNTRHVNANVNT
jgi:hypothetical protein